MPNPEEIIARLTPEQREAIFAALWLVTASDGILGSKEKELILQWERRLLIPSESARAIEHDARNRTLEMRLPSDPDARRLTMVLALKTIWSDRKISASERILAKRLGEACGLNDSDVFDRLPAASEPPRPGNDPSLLRKSPPGSDFELKITCLVLLGLGLIALLSALFRWELFGLIFFGVCFFGMFGVMAVQSLRTGKVRVRGGYVKRCSSPIQYWAATLLYCSMVLIPVLSILLSILK